MDCLAEDIKRSYVWVSVSGQIMINADYFLWNFNKTQIKKSNYGVFVKMKDAAVHLSQLSVTHYLTKNERE